MLSATDVESLYRARATYLERLVRRGTAATEQVVEDACQHAWSSVLAHRERVEGHAAFAWLTSAAMREAWRLTRRDGCQGAIDGLSTDEGSRAASTAEVAELRDRLRQLQRLPTRQQRLLWLHAAGLSYAEMARHEGVTVRTVERQLLRAKQRVRALDA